MDFSEVAARISQKINAKGQHVDQKKVEGKLRRLVEEFGVPPAEAERAVLLELSREFGITGLGSGSGELKLFRDVSPGEWVTVEGKVVSLSMPPTPAIAQTGIIADDSGAMRFVVWAKAQAVRMVQGKWYRLESAVVDEFRGIPNLKIHSGTSIQEVEHEGALIPSLTPIADLTPGVGSVRAKMIQEWEVTHERMLQSGLLADESGTIKFVIWKEEGRERLLPDTVYTFYYALVDEFNGRLSLNLNTATVIPEEGDIQVASGEREAIGALVHLAPGSGLIKRCPVAGCGRVLSRQNYCPVHEIQPDFTYDLRIKGWLDDGSRTWEVLLPREVTETLTGMTLDQARSLAENNPLGMDEVFLRVRDTILGRYLRCQGREIDRRILSNRCEFIRFDTAEHAALLNRAGGTPV
jgi:replication factor A1